MKGSQEKQQPAGGKGERKSDTHIFVILMECKQISVCCQAGLDRKVFGVASSCGQMWCTLGAGSAPQATASTPVAPPAVHKLHSRYFYLL